MNLASHAAVLWRFRAIAIGGLVLGLVLALLASYSVAFKDGKPSLTPRGSETWRSESSLLVTHAGFPEGRTTLPGGDPATGQSGSTRSQGGLDFAPPARLSELAPLYAELAVSDSVRDRLPQRPAREQIEAIPLEGPAATQLPVIKLATLAGSAAAAHTLNDQLVNALRGELAREQSRNEIPPRQRIRLSLLSAPAAPVKTAGRSHTASIIALLLCLLGAVAVAHLLAALRDRPDGELLAGVALANGNEHSESLPEALTAPNGNGHSESLILPVGMSTADDPAADPPAPREIEGSPSGS